VTNPQRYAVVVTATRSIIDRLVMTFDVVQGIGNIDVDSLIGQGQATR
jgi:hypothetical protein